MTDPFLLYKFRVPVSISENDLSRREKAALQNPIRAIDMIIVQNHIYYNIIYEKLKRK